jgi:hypothetical protein
MECDSALTALGRHACTLVQAHVMGEVEDVHMCRHGLSSEYDMFMTCIQSYLNWGMSPAKTSTRLLHSSRSWWDLSALARLTPSSAPCSPPLQKG